MDNNKNNKRNRPVVKTYKDFATKALKSNTSSLAKMIIKEKEKEELKEKRSLKNKKNILMLFLSIIFFTLGILAIVALVFFTFYKTNDIEKKNKPLEPRALIYFDFKEEKEIKKNENRNDLIQISQDFINETKIPIGGNKILYFVSRDENNFKELLSAKEFLKILDTRAGESFIRSMSGDFTFGLISNIERNSPYLIFSILSFDTVYNAILTWEKTLLPDLGPYLNVDRKYYSNKFFDLNLFNKDVRVVLNKEGEIVFGYSFFNMKTLIFFTDSNSFKKIVNLLENKKIKF